MNAGQKLDASQELSADSANQELTARWQGALMNNYGTPACPSSGARAARCGTPTARRTPTSWAASP